MNDEEKDITTTPIPAPTDTASTSADGAPTSASEESVEDRLIRNDVIPETNSDTPGSIGAFPVGAFENNKE